MKLWKLTNGTITVLEITAQDLYGAKFVPFTSFTYLMIRSSPSISSQNFQMKPTTAFLLSG